MSRTGERKRRTREETRQLLLDAAVRVVLARSNGDLGGSTNPLAGIRITEVLEEVNRQLRDADPDATLMTTGAAYNIWPTQEDFQASLLDRILSDAAVPGIDEVRAVLDRAIDEGAHWHDVVARVLGHDFEVSFREPTMFVMIGVTALGPAERIAELNKAANARYVADTSALLRRILDYAGRRLMPGRSIEDLVWAVEAVETGYLLRRRSMPRRTSRTDANRRTAVQAALIGVIEAFTEPG
jgi:hypothetical protein